MGKDGEAGVDARKKVRAADNRQLLKMVDRVQSVPRAQLFQIDLKPGFMRDEQILENKLRPWLERKIDFTMGGMQSDLTEYILRKINGVTTPDALIQDLSRFLDDHADPLIERMWRMLAFELMINGHCPQIEAGDKWS